MSELFIALLALLVAAVWWRRHRRRRHTIDEWMDAAYPNRDYHREIMDAIYAEHDRTVDVPAADLVWVMSLEWFHEVRGVAVQGVSDATLNYAAFQRKADAFINQTLLGIPVEVRDDAGFPKLVRREGV